MFELARTRLSSRLMVFNIDNAEQLTDFLAPNLNVDVAQKQAILRRSSM